MSIEIDSKLKKLKEYWYNDDWSLKWVEETEKAIRRLIVSEELSKNKGIIPIIEDARNRIETINKLLIYDEEMTIDTRKMLMREKMVHQFYLDRFDGRDLDKRFEMVGKVLDEELKKIGAQE